MRDNTTDNTHPCPGRDCHSKVPNNQLACRTHWRELPREMRDRIWQTYRKGAGGEDHTAAILDAVRYLRAEAEDTTEEADE